MTTELPGIKECNIIGSCVNDTIFQLDDTIKDIFP
jgi:hypothetical protein